MTEKGSKSTTDRAERISAEFHGFCSTVIRRSILNQLRGYVRHCRNYGTIPLREADLGESGVYDEILEEKIRIPAYGTLVAFDNERLAAALLELPETKREIVLRNAALGYSLLEIAKQLDLGYDTVRNYKSHAIKELRGKVGVDEEKV